MLGKLWSWALPHELTLHLPGNPPLLKVVCGWGAGQSLSRRSWSFISAFIAAGKAFLRWYQARETEKDRERVRERGEGGREWINWAEGRVRKCTSVVRVDICWSFLIRSSICEWQRMKERERARCVYNSLHCFASADTLRYKQVGAKSLYNYLYEYYICLLYYIIYYICYGDSTLLFASIQMFSSIYSRVLRRR